MRPGTGEALVTLDRRHEIKALVDGVESGVNLGDLKGLSLAITDQAYEQDYRDPNYAGGPESTPPYRLKETPELKVTPENVDDVVTSLEALVALGGIEGTKATVLGRKRTAKNILRVLN